MALLTPPDRPPWHFCDALLVKPVDPRLRPCVPPSPAFSGLRTPASHSPSALRGEPRLQPNTQILPLTLRPWPGACTSEDPPPTPQTTSGPCCKSGRVHPEGPSCSVDPGLISSFAAGQEPQEVGRGWFALSRSREEAATWSVSPSVPPGLPSQLGTDPHGDTTAALSPAACPGFPEDETALVLA